MQNCDALSVAEMCKKVIDKCNKIAEKEEITQRQRYTRESKQLVRDTYNSSHPKRAKQAKKAKKRLKTIANAMLRELDRKMTDEQKSFYRNDLELYKRAVNQQKTTKTKFTASTSLLQSVFPKAWLLS